MSTTLSSLFFMWKQRMCFPALIDARGRQNSTLSTCPPCSVRMGLAPVIGSFADRHRSLNHCSPCVSFSSRTAQIEKMRHDRERERQHRLKQARDSGRDVGSLALQNTPHESQVLPLGSDSEMMPRIRDVNCHERRWRVVEIPVRQIGEDLEQSGCSQHANTEGWAGSRFLSHSQLQGD